MNKIKIFAHESAKEFAQEICNNLNIPLGVMNVIKFKNDNSFVQIMETIREYDVYIILSTLPPVNERVMELLISIDAIKRAAPRRLNVVLPYYIYSRSDKKDQPRIPVTAKLMAQLIEAAGADRVITCDLHNPAIQAYFNIHCDRLSAQSLLLNYFNEKKLEELVVVATDAGSSKKAYKYTEYFGCPMAIIDKRRDGNNDKAIATHVIGTVKGKNALIIDDEIDTAGSIIETANILHNEGAKEIYAGCTHGVLSADAVQRIEKSPIRELVITNTVPLPNHKKIDKIKVLSIAPLFAEAIQRINEARSIGEIYE